MHYSHNFHQPSLFNFKTYGFHVEDSPLFKIANGIDWSLLIKEVIPLFAKEGRNSKSIRMVLGLEMVKTYYAGISDQIIVNKLKTDAEIMYFCGFDKPPTDKEIPDSSSMTRFRNKLTKKVINRLNSVVVRKVICKLPPRKRSQVASDSSCLPAKITYPTDTKVLTQATNKLIKIVEGLRTNGRKIIIRGRRGIVRRIKTFNKIRRKSKTQIRQIKKELLKFNSKMLGIIDKYKSEFTEQIKTTVKVSELIIEQQMKMYKDEINRVPNRIVSFHENKVRPIFRGKLNGVTEFGKKISIMVIGQKILVPNLCEYDNFSDTSLLEKDLKRFEEITGRKPKEYSGDRGFHSPENHDILERERIKDGIQYRGKIPKKATRPCSATIRRLRNQRSPVEGKLGTIKTSYGCSKIDYKSENTEVRLGFAAIMHNMKWFVC